MDEAIDLRSNCAHFRVLILGKANAGKTSLLKKVCDSIDEPEVYSPSGRKVRSGLERNKFDCEYYFSLIQRSFRNHLRYGKS